jgi:hypothetical protein
MAILFDIRGRPQPMAIMNVVWPVSALFGNVLVLALYLRFGRANQRSSPRGDERAGPDKRHGARQTPLPIAVAKAALHCGSGCAIGDLIAEWLAFAFPALVTWLGWPGLFQDRMYAVWVLDFALAFVIGIVFQYFAIVPMRGLSFREGVIAALKADTLSLAAWQVGMYGFMAFAQLFAFKALLGSRAEVDTVEFWFAMQLAMVAGFITSYPVNWWLVRAGIKERM